MINACHSLMGFFFCAKDNNNGKKIRERARYPDFLFASHRGDD